MYAGNDVFEQRVGADPVVLVPEAQRVCVASLDQRSQPGVELSTTLGDVEAEVAQELLGAPLK
jgi:hypothetical protein